MTQDTYNGAGGPNDGNGWGLILAAVLLVAGGLGLMVWDDSHRDGPPTGFLRTSQSR
jgi:hypothetical protein